jgi:subtilisin family serine protease
MKSIILRLVALILVLSTVISPANAKPGIDQRLASRPNLDFTLPALHGQEIQVDPALVRRLASDETSSYLIYFRQRADLSPAYQMDWEERGWFVLETLQAVAETTQKGVRAYLDAQNVDYQAFWIDNVIAVKSSNLAAFNGLMTFAVIDRLQAEPQVTLIEPETVSLAYETLLGIEANIAHVNAPQVWDLGYNGAGITVASIDTGVRYTHQALVKQYRGNLGGGVFNHNYNWWDSPEKKIAPIDKHGHGTHTVGIMVGDDGESNQIGMAPGADWMACRGCANSSCASTDLLVCGQFMAAPWDLAGINPNPDMRPHVVNNSWGNCDQIYNPWYQGVVDSWQAAGIYPLFANGNAGNCEHPSPPGLNTVGNPARYGNVTGVGSSGKSDGQYATYSAWGPTDNLDTVNPNGYPTIKPQVVAPGVGIRSSVHTSDSDYGSMSGTSMSAPHVAGLVALMWQAAPWLQGDYAATETILQNTANPIPYATGNGDEGPGNVPNHATGWGEIDALAAVTNFELLHAIPESREVTLALDTTISLPLTLYNISNRDIDFQIAILGNSELSSSYMETISLGKSNFIENNTPSWVSADPKAGTIGAMASQEFEVTFDAGLPVGDYHARLIVLNEDNPLLLEVPLTMTVVAEGSYSLSLSPAEASLSVYPGESVTYLLTLENSGNVTDLIGLHTSVTEWPVHLSAETIVLNPLSSAGLSVMVTVPHADSLEAASHEVTITAISNGNGSVTASTTLTTTSQPRRIFLPLALR